MAEDYRHATLGVISFGLALGVTFTIVVFLLGVVAAIFGWGAEIARALASLYIGYGPTFVGSITGAVWAFANGFVIGVLIAWLYNRFLLRRRHGP
ncbi:MAG: bacteriophage holin [Kiloniellales bacterium]